MNKPVSRPRDGGYCWSVAVVLALALVFMAQPPLLAQEGEQSPAMDAAPDTDIFLYAGWKVFHSNCHTCHGAGAVGTDIAPNLVERVPNMTPEQFATKVLTRYRIIVSAHEAAADGGGALREAILREVREHERGEAGELIMPAWEYDEVVKPHVVDLYDYLMARAEGTLGPGEPTPPY